MMLYVMCHCGTAELSTPLLLFATLRLHNPQTVPQNSIPPMITSIINLPLLSITVRTSRKLVTNKVQCNAMQYYRGLSLRILTKSTVRITKYKVDISAPGVRSNCTMSSQTPSWTNCCRHRGQSRSQ